MRTEDIERVAKSLMPVGVDELLYNGMGLSLQPLWPKNPGLGCRLSLYFKHLAEPRSVEGTVHELSDLLDMANVLIRNWPEAGILSTYNSSFNHIVVVPGYVESLSASADETRVNFNRYDLSIRSQFKDAQTANDHLTVLHTLLRSAARKSPPKREGNVTYVDFGKR